MELPCDLISVLARWGLENEPVQAVPDPAGIAKKTNVWFVGRDLVLKRSRDRERLRTHILLARLLASQGLEAALAVPAGDGSELLCAGEWVFCVMKRLRGSHLRSRELYGPGGKERAERLGEAIGRLSLALRTFDAPVEKNDLFATVSGWALPRVRELLDLPDSFCTSYTEQFARLNPLLPRQLIHRDPHPGNILFTEKSCAFFDFDLCEENIRLFDPVYAAGSILRETFDEEKTYALARWLPLLRAILRGYDTAAPLTPEEKAAVPCVMIGIECIFVAWCAEQPSMRPLFEASASMLRMFREKLWEQGKM